MIEIGIIIGLASLGLTAYGIAFAIFKWRKKQPDEDTDSDHLNRLVDVEREKLEQQKQEHQWRQFRDFMDWFAGLLHAIDEEEDYEEY